MGVLRDSEGAPGRDLFQRDRLPSPTRETGGTEGTWANFQFPAQSTTANPGAQGSAGVLNEAVINEILAATHASETWKACVVENTSWEGTAEENINKYRSVVGSSSALRPES